MDIHFVFSAIKLYGTSPFHKIGFKFQFIPY